MLKKIIIFGLFLLIFLVAKPSFAANLEIKAQNNATIDECHPYTKMAQTAVLTFFKDSEVEGGLAGFCFGYVAVKFDLSQIPAHSTIISAGVKLRTYYLINTNFVDVYLAKPNNDWNESNATVNQLGEYQMLNISNRIYKTIVDNDYTWDTTSIVQQWLNGSLANHGLALVPNDLDSTISDYTLTFYSRQATNGGPVLSINYLVPTPTPSPTPTIISHFLPVQVQIKANQSLINSINNLSNTTTVTPSSIPSATITLSPSNAYISQPVTTQTEQVGKENPITTSTTAHLTPPNSPKAIKSSIFQPSNWFVNWLRLIILILFFLLLVFFIIFRLQKLVISKKLKIALSIILMIILTVIIFIFFYWLGQKSQGPIVK